MYRSKFSRWNIGCLTYEIGKKPALLWWQIRVDGLCFNAFQCTRWFYRKGSPKLFLRLMLGIRKIKRSIIQHIYHKRLYRQWNFTSIRLKNNFAGSLTQSDRDTSLVPVKWWLTTSQASFMLSLSSYLKYATKFSTAWKLTMILLLNITESVHPTPMFYRKLHGWAYIRYG